MKQTRKIFVLNDYSRVEEKILLHELKFKALVVFYSKEVTENELVNVFENNKSALCISCKLPKCYEKKSIVCNNLNFDESIIKQFEDFAISHNCDIGDHKSNSSGLSGTPTAEDCAYCKFLNGPSGTHHTILYSSANFFCNVYIGAIY